MKRLFIIFILFLFYLSICVAQITYNPYVWKKNNNCTIDYIELTDDETIVKMTVYAKPTWRIGRVTVLVPSDEWNINDTKKYDFTPPPGVPTDPYLLQSYNRVVNGMRKMTQELSDAGYLIRNLGNLTLDQWYKSCKNGCTIYMHFDRLPYGVNDIYIRELYFGGWEWVGIRINNPYPTVEDTHLTEESIKNLIEKQDDGIVGVYEGISDNKYRLACIKHKDIFKLIYLGSEENISHWKLGEVKAILKPSATNGLFKANYHMKNKTLEEVVVTFDGASMRVIFDDGTTSSYIKMYPTSETSQGKKEVADKSGTGFALNKGHIVTNYHVVEEAKTILVKGIKGDFNTEYIAEVVASDKNNDIAILKINDNRFKGFGTIPYKIKKPLSEVGETIWTLGYPLTAVMGDEVKFTDGKISSRTGIQGDMSVYQISVPIQPGNSGGPLFDNFGNIVGITSAGLNREIFNSENVNYAIKTSYLYNLIESSLNTSILPQGSAMQGQSLQQKIKLAKNFVFMILCSSDENFHGVIDKTEHTKSALDINKDTGNIDDQYIHNEDTINHKTENIFTKDSVFNNPKCFQSAFTKDLFITKVTLTKEYTIINFKLHNKENNAYTYYIGDKANLRIWGSQYSKKEYQLLKFEGISNSPEYSIPAHSYREFTLYFERLPNNCEGFDFIDDESNPYPNQNYWKIYNIELK